MVPRSINDPVTTNEVNISGFLNMLIAVRDAGVKRMVYAASSSTYGDSEILPKVEEEPAPGAAAAATEPEVIRQKKEGEGEEGAAPDKKDSAKGEKKEPAKVEAKEGTKKEPAKK